MRKQMSILGANIAVIILDVNNGAILDVNMIVNMLRVIVCVDISGAKFGVNFKLRC